MKTTKLFSIAFLLVLVVASSDVFSQSSEDLKGRWEGVHYYGDTTRLYDGRLLVRSTTIDSMKMTLIVEQMQEGKFTGKVHEHFYSDPKGSYFNADVTGFIDNEKIHFTSFDIRENKLPAGYRWCEPKATGVLVKGANSFSLNISFETSLTCTVGPAVLERTVLENITITPPVLPKKEVATNQSERVPISIQPKEDLSSIAEKFRTRNRLVINTIKVQSDSIKINFFDNGTIDGDSISVFINGRLEASNVRLTTVVYSIKVGFEKGKDEIEVGMFAENLGTIPPNTALMQIVDGSKIHQAYLSSDTKSNAVIKIKQVK